MWEWLNKDGVETVLISLGTHFRLDEQQAGAVWAGVKAILDARGDVQVLWKLCKKGEFTLGNKEERERYGLGERVRVVEWLESEPVDLLRSGKVGMVVHHGGSNSYHEALA
jgi:UDP:flavonoid glycosyltransferase YjiC (YdhE family)